MPFYENVFIARQELSTAQVEALAAQFTDTIKAGGGEVVKNEMWGLKNLSYRIKKNRKGHYVMLGLSAAPAVVQELERTQQLNEDVIRFLTIRVEAIGAEPSAMLASRGREDRGFDRDDRSRDDRPRRPREPLYSTIPVFPTDTPAETGEPS